MADLTIPPQIAAIIERLHTQDNRITANPLFAVQQKRIVGGLNSDYADSFAWICEGCEVGPEEAARLDALREAGEPIPDDCRRVGYIEQWEFVTGCLTEQGCKDYIRANGHNLKEPRIYAYGSYRNAEFIALREWLMSLRPAGVTEVPAPVYHALLAECLERIEDNWHQIDGEWGPSDGGLPGAIARGEETLIPKLRAAIGVMASHPMRDGYLSSVLVSDENGHKLTMRFATREQADAAQAWLADGVTLLDGEGHPDRQDRER